ncbi:MAG: amidohydrolase family protein [Pseudomonadota bacterium]
MTEELKDDDTFTITNCHIHTFTLKHVPKRFLPFGLTQALASLPLQSAVTFLLHLANPFNKRDRLSRYANFLEIGGQRTQEQIFEIIKDYYPENTRFVVLPMDMAFMGAGEPPVDIHAQHDELEVLAQRYPDLVLPFLAIDPRRYDGGSGGQALTEELKKRFAGNPEDRIFRGIKLYPPQGYSPADRRLKPMWEFCSEHNVPILTHCSRGGVHNRGFSQSKVDRYTDPDVYLPLLKQYPNVKVCLAHFGGDDDWEDYFERPESRVEVPLTGPFEDRKSMNWVPKIIQIMESGEYPGLYTDVSYTIFSTQKLLPAISVILRNRSKVRAKTLFGSDYYMTQNEKFDERYLSMQLRHSLGEAVFREIAETNPRKFLR